jgi:response regulator NasT
MATPTATTGTSAPKPTAPLRILIVEDDTLVGMGLRKQLERMGHQVVGHGSNTVEATDLYREVQPDLVFMDIRLDETDGIELAGRLLKERRCPMIILSAYSDAELIQRAGAVGVFGYLIKPATPESLRAQIEVALERFRDSEKLRAEKDKLATDLETRKLMDRAKGILMKRANLPEDEAHRRLQQESQKRRLSMIELCKKIIESEELLGGGL